MQYDSDRAKRIREQAGKGIPPLVTLFIATYNQERYIADAVKSALAQTYSPLEVVISDDCSSDKTWQIIQETVFDYKGPHKIVLNRNEKNLGVTAHIEVIYTLAHGDFVVAGAGDDIVLSNKVEVMVNRWARDGYRPIVVFTNGYWMSESGEKLDVVMAHAPTVQTRTDFLKFPATYMPGALAGASADIREIFGPMNAVHSSSEDVATAIRGVLLDHLVYEDVPTTLWRRAGLWSGMNDRKYDKFKYWSGMRASEPIARQALCDAMMLRDAEAISAMCRYWQESNYRASCVLLTGWRLPSSFLRAWRDGGRFIHLLRWTYHAVRYRWLYVLRPFLGLDKTKYAPLKLRESIYGRSLDAGELDE